MKPKFETERFKTSDPLTAFLYVLLRDHVPFGVVETIMLEQIENGLTGEGFLSEPTIGGYAAQLSRRLQPERPTAGARRFPIQGGPSLPWEMVIPHARQCRENHEQTLEQLARRGGLSPSEMLAVMDGEKWFASKWGNFTTDGSSRGKHPKEIAALKELTRRLQEFERPEVPRVVRSNLKAIVVRCEEGDPRSDWLPIISRLATEALDAMSEQRRFTESPALDVDGFVEYAAARFHLDGDAALRIRLILDGAKVRAKWKEIDGESCAVCGEARFKTSAGLTCENGHGDAPSFVPADTVIESIKRRLKVLPNPENLIVNDADFERLVAELPGVPAFVNDGAGNLVPPEMGSTQPGGEGRPIVMFGVRVVAPDGSPRVSR